MRDMAMTYGSYFNERDMAMTYGSYFNERGYGDDLRKLF